MKFPTSVDDQIVKWTVAARREFHRYPELSFHENATQKRLIEYLEELGIEVMTLAGTGVVGQINGCQDGPCFALRADMNALPVSEEQVTITRVSSQSMKASCMPVATMPIWR